MLVMMVVVVRCQLDSHCISEAVSVAQLTVSVVQCQSISTLIAAVRLIWYSGLRSTSALRIDLLAGQADIPHPTQKNVWSTIHIHR